MVIFCYRKYKRSPFVCGVTKPPVQVPLGRGPSWQLITLLDYCADNIAGQKIGKKNDPYSDLALDVQSDPMFKNLGSGCKSLASCADVVLKPI